MLGHRHDGLKVVLGFGPKSLQSVLSIGQGFPGIGYFLPGKV